MRLPKPWLLPVLLGCSSNSQAIDWLLHPEYSQSERYDDNITMQVSNRHMIDSLITTLSPTLTLGYQTQDQDLKSHFRWNELVYHDAPALDFSEKLLDVNHGFQGEWFKTGLEASYHEQSSINTQLDIGGSGQLASRLIPQTQRSISPNVLFSLDERNSLRLDYSYQDVVFQRPAGYSNTTSYSDYRSQQLSATGIHNYSERLTLTATGAYSLFDTANDGVPHSAKWVCWSENAFYPCTVTSRLGYQQQSTTFFYQAGLQYVFDELTQLSFSAGMRDSNNHSLQQLSTGYSINPKTGKPYHDPIDKQYRINSSASGHVFSASLTRHFARGNFSVNAGQQLNPSSSGQQQQTTQFGVQARLNLSERWSSGLNFSHQISQSSLMFNSANNAAGKPISFNRTYTSITPDIQWRWTPEINLQLSYTLRQQEYVDSGLTAVGNSIQLLFSYQPQINRQVK